MEMRTRTNILSSVLCSALTLLLLVRGLNSMELVTYMSLIFRSLPTCEREKTQEWKPELEKTV